MSIAENLAHIQHHISAAALRAGRDPSKIRLVAVSKTQSAEPVRSVFAW